MSDAPLILFEQAFQLAQALTATFRANEKHYLSKDYQEQEARQDFIDKFWTALGWDVTHQTQTNPYAQEVKVERGVQTGASTTGGGGARAWTGRSTRWSMNCMS